jgi:hypothetical protein
MIVFAIVVTLLLMGGLFLLYKGFQIISEDNKLLRLQLHEQQQEMINIIKDFDYNMIMVLGSELGDNLKKFIKLKGKGDVVLRNGKAVKVDVDY